MEYPEMNKNMETASGKTAQKDAQAVSAVYKPGADLFEMRGEIVQGQGDTTINLSGAGLPNNFKARFMDFDGTITKTVRGKTSNGRARVTMPRQLSATPGQKRCFIMDDAGKLRHVLFFNVEPNSK